jgi:3-isopropylmalate/(R)-2-methylmalate dehydratase large subunit
LDHPNAKTLFQKIWDQHVIHRRDDGTCLLWIDRHLIHEVTSPQAFDGLRDAARTVRRPDLTLAVADHNVSTKNRMGSVADKRSAAQLAALTANCAEFAVPYVDILSPNQGIVHVIGPEQGFTLPGLTLVCGDSHTATHGAFGALAMGIGTSEVEHVLATQALWVKPPKTLDVELTGKVGDGVTAKDIALAIAAALPGGQANGYSIEYTGDAIVNLSMEGRMTVCNMGIEVGARTAIIAPDDITFDYLCSRPLAPSGADWESAVRQWRLLRSDPEAIYDARISIDCSAIAPMVSWGTSSDDVVSINGVIPDPAEYADPAKREQIAKSLAYMDLVPGTPLTEIEIQNIFIGSCTNGRIEDLRAAAAILKGKHVAANIRQALVVPGSGLVRRQAESEGLDQIFKSAGFEWREAGCSMCLSMNDDRVPPGERCASTSNRSFMGRQGPGSRTHLVSPPMAAAAAIAGKLVDVRLEQAR